MSMHAVLDPVAGGSRQARESIEYFDVLDPSGRTIGVAREIAEGDPHRLAVRLNWQRGITWISNEGAQIDWDQAVIRLPCVVTL